MLGQFTSRSQHFIEALIGQRIFRTLNPRRAKIIRQRKRKQFHTFCLFSLQKDGPRSYQVPIDSQHRCAKLIKKALELRLSDQQVRDTHCVYLRARCQRFEGSFQEFKGRIDKANMLAHPETAENFKMRFAVLLLLMDGITDCPRQVLRSARH